MRRFNIEEDRSRAALIWGAVGRGGVRRRFFWLGCRSQISGPDPNLVQPSSISPARDSLRQASTIACSRSAGVGRIDTRLAPNNAAR